MNADHRRALFAFFVVAGVCALLIGQGVRPNSDFFDYIVGRSATPPSVSDSVTLEPRADEDDAEAPRTPADPARSNEDGGATGVTTGGAAAGAGDSGPGRSPDHARTPDRGQGNGGGKPSAGKADLPGKSQRGHARTGDDGGRGVTARSDERGQGKKKGHHKDRAGRSDLRRGRTAH